MVLGAMIFWKCMPFDKRTIKTADYDIRSKCNITNTRTATKLIILFPPSLSPRQLPRQLKLNFNEDLKFSREYVNVVDLWVTTPFILVFRNFSERF
jgi:hypothetical protein